MQLNPIQTQPVRDLHDLIRRRIDENAHLRPTGRNPGNDLVRSCQIDAPRTAVEKIQTYGIGTRQRDKSRIDDSGNAANLYSEQACDPSSVASGGEISRSLRCRRWFLLLRMGGPLSAILA